MTDDSMLRNLQGVRGILISFISIILAIIIFAKVNATLGIILLLSGFVLMIYASFTGNERFLEDQSKKHESHIKEMSDAKLLSDYKLFKTFGILMFILIALAYLLVYYGIVKIYIYLIAISLGLGLYYAYKQNYEQELKSRNLPF